MQRGVSTKAPALFRGRFRVQSTRLPTWDYTSNGYYFLTICTKDREPFLGEIIDGSMQLSKIGEIVADEWRQIAIKRRDVWLDEWVVMPNHLHGIVVIAREPCVETPQRPRVGDRIASDQLPTERPHGEAMQRGVFTRVAFRILPGSLAAIIGQFKSRATKRAWQLGFEDFGWQRRFYDHIIRDDTSLDNIRQYIVENPAKWESHEELPENLWM
jgi:REP element-mobilizing transposase RayT